MSKKNPFGRTEAEAIQRGKEWDARMAALRASVTKPTPVQAPPPVARPDVVEDS